jgi:hypothetical protein
MNAPAPAPAPTPTSNITRLPTAAAEPVQQQPRRGRFPKAVACYRRAQRAKEWSEWLEEEKQREIAKLDDAWWQALNYMQGIEIRLRELGAVPTRLHHKWS